MTLLEQVEKSLSTEEGRRELNNMFKETERHEELMNRWSDKLWAKSKEERGNIIEKIIDKYHTDEYKNRWYNRGQEPPMDLFEVIFTCAEKYGKEAPHVEEMWGPFSSESYVLDNYLVRLLLGQGSFVLVEKVVFNSRIFDKLENNLRVAKESVDYYNNIFDHEMKLKDGWLEFIAYLENKYYLKLTGKSIDNSSTKDLVWMPDKSFLDSKLSINSTKPGIYSITLTSNLTGESIYTTLEFPSSEFNNIANYSNIWSRKFGKISRG